ncbi:leucine-rich repeats and immunoglobulin-like domains protein 2 isoform X1 [Littorina saxatilis]|uniref:Ig-like domain-containing protein n=1 Tax=Littorina saxatilis TaxID=31220 RepID=A0AAN9GBA0_9CAEN
MERTVKTRTGCSLLIVIFLLGLTQGQLNFGQEERFQLTSSKSYFRPGEDVTLTCKKTVSQDNDKSARSLVFPESNKGITWERNGQTMFSTTTEKKVCRVQPHVLLGRPAVTQRELQAVTCEEDMTSVNVTIQNVTISPRGDRWVCAKFPFIESNTVSLYNFVPLSVVTLTVQDHFPNDATTGVLMTLVCQASPCNPPPSVTWQLMRDGKPLPLPGGSRTRSQVDGYGRVTLAMELALGADPRFENATATCRASNTPGVWLDSNRLTLTIKRPPRILMTANPSNEVTEGTDVTLTCGAHGHPRPEVSWRKDGGFLPGGLLEADTPILRLSPARLPDRGEYVCKAFNNVPPGAVNSIYLKVDEPLRTLKISDEDRSMEISDKSSDKDSKDKQNNDVTNKEDSTDNSSRHNDSSNNDDSSNGGTIAAVIVSILVVLGAVGLGLLWVLYRRRKQNYMSSPGSIDSLFPHYPDRCMTAPRPGMYAPRSSLRPPTHGSLTMDSVPQYLELPPAPLPPVGITNRGYGISPKSRKNTKVASGRPLPATPTEFDESRYTWDSGYDEIRDVSPELGRMTSHDGYEVPVLHEEDEEECIYDVAKPEEGSRPYSVRRPTYMNDGPFSTHM